jgi:hypothetical protein
VLQIGGFAPGVLFFPSRAADHGLCSRCADDPSLDDSAGPSTSSTRRSIVRSMPGHCAPISIRRFPSCMVACRSSATRAIRSRQHLVPANAVRPPPLCDRGRAIRRRRIWRGSGLTGLERSVVERDTLGVDDSAVREQPCQVRERRSGENDYAAAFGWRLCSAFRVHGLSSSRSNPRQSPTRQGGHSSDRTEGC